MMERYLRALHSGATVITANARLARVIQREYGRGKRAGAGAGGPAVWSSPTVMPWHSWLESLWRESLYRSADQPPEVLLRPIQEAALWEEVVAESEEASALLDIPATARAAAAAWELLNEWRLDLRSPAWGESEDTAAFLNWTRRFQSRCGAGNWLSRSLLADSVLAGLRDGRSHPPNLLFAGFDEFTPRQRQVLSALARAGIGIEVVETSSGETRGAVRRIALADTHQELAGAAQWCRAVLAADPDASIVVVIPGLSAVRAEAERIFLDVLHPGAILPGGSRGGLAFDISLGLSLAGYPVVHAALLALDLAMDPLPLGPVGNLLRSPYFRGGLSESSNRALLDAALRRRGGVEIRSAVLQAFAANPPAGSNAPPCPVLAEALSNCRAFLQGLPLRQSCSRWAAGFSRFLDLLGWPGERNPNSEEYQTIEKWHALLDEFTALDAVVGPPAYRQAAATLRRLAQETIFQPESPEAPIRILGALEAAGQEFGHLWVAGLHDAAWPPAAKPHPFIPVRLQREHGLPHASASRELVYTELITNRLLSAAPDVVVSHPRREGDLELRPSRLITQWPETSLGELVPEPVPSFTGIQFGSASIERIEDRQAPPLPATATPAGGTSILKEQAACPFRAFAKLRLHAQPLDVPQPGLTPLDRGNLVHASLETIWKQLGSHAALAAASERDLTDLIRSSVAKAIRGLRTGGSQSPARMLAVESDLLATLLAQWLEHEKTREPFSILHIEHRKQVRLSDVEMNLRADRIDRLEDGRHVLLDYKTGSPSPSQWEGERPDEPQLPLYAVTSGLDLAAVAFAQVKRGDLRLKGIASGPGVLPEVKPEDAAWETRLAEWRNVLEKLAADFRDGYCAVDPKNPGNRQGGTCSYCGLQPFCRIAEAALAAWDDGGEELAGAAHA